MCVTRLLSVAGGTCVANSNCVVELSLFLGVVCLSCNPFSLPKVTSSFILLFLLLTIWCFPPFLLSSLFLFSLSSLPSLPPLPSLPLPPSLPPSYLPSSPPPLQQVTTICQRMLKEKEEQIREEYQKVLTTKLAGKE